MPVKKRKSKKKAYQFTPEVFAAFEAGNEYCLRRALKLPPWHATPLDTDLAGLPPYGSEELLINITRPDALEIRQEILAAMKRTRVGTQK